MFLILFWWSVLSAVGLRLSKTGAKTFTPCFLRLVQAGSSFAGRVQAPGDEVEALKGGVVLQEVSTGSQRRAGSEQPSIDRVGTEQDRNIERKERGELVPGVLPQRCSARGPTPHGDGFPEPVPGLSHTPGRRDQSQLAGDPVPVRASCPDERHTVRSGAWPFRTFGPESSRVIGLRVRTFRRALLRVL